MQLAKHDVEVRLASSAHMYQQSVGPNVAAAVTNSDVKCYRALTPSRPHALTPSRPHAHNLSTNLFKKVLIQGCMCPNHYKQVLLFVFGDRSTGDQLGVELCVSSSILRDNILLCRNIKQKIKTGEK